MRETVAFSFALVAILLAWPSYAQQDSTNAVPASITFVNSGGHWKLNGRYGHYRVLVSNFGFEAVRSTVQVQWIEEKEVNGVIKIVPIKEINECECWSVSFPEILGSEKGTTLKLAATNPYTMQDTAFVFLLTDKLQGKKKK